MKQSKFPTVTVKRAAEQIIAVSRRLYERDWLAACDGNISMRLSADKILITPTGRSKAHLKAKDFAVISLDGKILQGQPSGERQMHLAVYRACPEARAVVHAHPPITIAWSIAFPKLKELPADCCSELILALGSVPFVSYARPGTETMGDHIRAYLPKHKVMILSRHGSLAWGESLEEAYRGTERLEHSAKILFYAKQLGELHPLEKRERDVLYKMRQEMGNKIL